MFAFTLAHFDQFIERGAKRALDCGPGRAGIKLFFWSAHYDVSIRYIGHAEKWDTVHVDGSLDARDCTVTYLSEGRRLAVATVGRDWACLKAEVELERQ